MDRQHRFCFTSLAGMIYKTMGPIVVIDKSIIHGTGVDNMYRIRRYFSPLITPILMQEILADLAKDDTPESLKKTVSCLSYKTHGMSNFIVPSANDLIILSLKGENVPMNGQVPQFGGTRFRAKDGTYGMFYDEPIESQILRRWQNKEFTDDEHGQAKFYRNQNTAESITNLRELMKLAFKGITKFDNLEDLVSYVDETLGQKDFHNYVYSQIDSLLVKDKISNQIEERLRNCSFSSFNEFAPYAFYHYRLSYIFNLAVAQNFVKLTTKSKTHQDLQYLFYLPFSHGLISGDKEQLLLAPFILRENQFCINEVQLKEDLELDASGKTVKHTNNAWGSSLGHTHEEFYKKNKQIPRNVKSDDIAKEMIGKLDDSYDVEKNRMFRRKRSSKFDDFNLFERYSEVYGLIYEKFELDSEEKFEKLNKDISDNQVKSFYDTYADLWPPDTQLENLIDTDHFISTALYLGDIDLYDDYKKIISLLSLFDTIYIIDPFQNPWTRKTEFNPIASPNSFKADTLKIIHFMVMIHPLVMTDKVRIIPDLFDFHMTLREKLLNICKDKDRSIFDDCFTKEYMNDDSKKYFTQSLARLSDDKLKSYLSQNEKMTEKQLNSLMDYIRSEAKKDPTFLDQGFPEDKKGYLELKRSGCNFEASIIISAFLYCIPSTFLSFRKKEYELFSDKKDWVDDINNYFRENKIKLFSGVPDSFKFLEVSELRPYVKLRTLLGEFREIHSSRLINDFWIETFKSRYIEIVNETEEMLKQVKIQLEEMVTGLEFYETQISVRTIENISSIQGVSEILSMDSSKPYINKQSTLFFGMEYTLPESKK
jgi:hypothetical protein